MFIILECNIVSTGYLITPRHVENILKIFLFRKDKKWEVVGQSFNLSDTDIADVMKCSTKTARITKLNECWLKTEENPQWWKVGKSLIKCCAEETTNIQEMMKYIEMWNYNGTILSDNRYNNNYFNFIYFTSELFT